MNEAISSNIGGKALARPNVIPISNNGIVIRMGVKIIPIPLNNEDKDIHVYFEQEIVSEERMSLHPNTNEKTIFVNTQDLFTFLKELGYEPRVIEL